MEEYQSEKEQNTGPLSSEDIHLLYVVHTLATHRRLLFAHEISISLPETQWYYHLGLCLSLCAME